MLGWLKGFRTAPKAPAGRRRVTITEAYEAIYAIGDVHGSYTELLSLEARILSDSADVSGRKALVFLGDLVDRGPESARVIEHLLIAPSGFDQFCLCGNHDDTFERFLTEPQLMIDWLEFGGDATVRSYGLDPVRQLRSGGAAGLAAALVEAVPATHRTFLRELPTMIRYQDYVFVHAGVQPGLPLDRQMDDDLMWIREPFLTRGPDLPITVVHGHSPSVEVDFGTRRVGVDTGAYATGRLSAVRIDASGVSVV